MRPEADEAGPLRAYAGEPAMTGLARLPLLRFAPETLLPNRSGSVWDISLVAREALSPNRGRAPGTMNVSTRQSQERRS